MFTTDNDAVNRYQERKVGQVKDGQFEENTFRGENIRQVTQV